jgi:heme/copper-type cytochrome/quinol oxidase subunit 2
VVLFVIFDKASLLMILLLLAMVWLAIIEVWGREDMQPLEKLWWVLLVLLTNFVGLIVLRAYVYWKSRREPRGGA